MAPRVTARGVAKRRTSKRNVKKITGTISPTAFEDFLANNFVPKLKSGPQLPHGGCAGVCQKSIKVGKKTLRCKYSVTTIRGKLVSIECVYG